MHVSFNLRDGVVTTVSIEDFNWVNQWKWNWRHDKSGKKKYVTRTSWRDGKRVTLYLHVELQKRKGGRRPSAAHVIVDHLDGDSLNNVRTNLRWATRSQNRKNQNGKAAKWYASREPKTPALP